MMKYILLISILIFFKGVFYAQDCKNELIALEKKYSKKNIEKQGNIQYYLLDVTNYFDKQSTLHTKSMVLEMFISKSCTQYESDLFSVYFDEKDFFLALHYKKIIIKKQAEARTGTGNEEELEKYYKDYRDSFNEFVKNAKNVTCRTFNFKGGRRLKMFSLKFDNPNDKGKIKEIKYYYDLDEERLYKIVTDFKNNKPLTQQKTIYKTVNYNYKKKKLKSAQQMIFKSPGKLLSKYYNYTLINE